YFFRRARPTKLTRPSPANISVLGSGTAYRRLSLMRTSSIMPSKLSPSPAPLPASRPSSPIANSGSTVVLKLRFILVEPNRTGDVNDGFALTSVQKKLRLFAVFGEPLYSTARWNQSPLATAAGVNALAPVVGMGMAML